MKQNTLVFLLVFYLAGNLYSQVNIDCSESIQKANSLYEKGNFEEAINLSKPCALGGNNAALQWQAYRLLALAYLGNNQVTEARAAAENMLELNPTYKPSYLKDPADLIKLLKSVNIIPGFSLGLAISLGSNTTFPDVESSYVLSDYNKTYFAKNSFQFGLSLGYQLNQHFELDFNLLASQKSYEVGYEFSNWKMNVAEKLTYLDMPLFLRYYFMPKKQIRPYVYAGVFGGFLLFSNTSYQAKNEDQNLLFELNNISTYDSRYKFNGGFSGGLGCSYKLRNGQAFVQVTYFKSMSKVVKPESRYQYSDLIYTYYYVDDDFKLNNLAISLGYSFNMNYKIIRGK